MAGALLPCAAGASVMGSAAGSRWLQHHAGSRAGIASLPSGEILLS